MAMLPPDPVYVMRGEMGPIHSLLFRITPSTEHLYAGTEAGVVHVWDLRKNRELFKLDSFKVPCLAMNFYKDEYLVTQRKGGKIDFLVAKESDWTISRTFKTQHSGFCRFQTTDDKIFMPLKDSKIGLFCFESNKMAITLDPCGLEDENLFGDVMAIKPCMDDGKYVLAVYDGGQMLLWDLRSKKQLSLLKVDHSPMTVDFNASLMRGIVGGPNEHLKIFSLSSDNELSEKTKLPLKNPGISIVSIRPDAKIFVTGGWDSRIRIYSLKKLRPLAVLDQHKATIHDIIFSKCQVESYNSKCLMAAAGKDGNISLWDLYN